MVQNWNQSRMLLFQEFFLIFRRQFGNISNGGEATGTTLCFILLFFRREFFVLFLVFLFFVVVIGKHKIFFLHFFIPSRQHFFGCFLFDKGVVLVLTKLQICRVSMIVRRLALSPISNIFNFFIVVVIIVIIITVIII